MPPKSSLIPVAEGQSSLFDAPDITLAVLLPSIIFTALATASVFARLYTRVKLLKTSGVEDIMLALSMVCGLTYCGVLCAAYQISSKVPHDDSKLLRELILALNTVWVLTTTSTKASLLLMYLRLLCTSSSSGLLRQIRRLTHLCLILLVPLLLYGVLGGILLCRPISRLWDGKKGTCASGQAYWLGVAVSELCLDTATWIIPIALLSHLRLGRKEACWVWSVWAAGSLVVAVGVVRLVIVSSVVSDGLASAVNAVLWSALEANVAIICAALMALKPLVMKIWPGLLDDRKIPRFSMQLPRIRTASIISGSYLDKQEESTLVESAAAVSVKSDTPPNQRRMGIADFGEIRVSDRASIRSTGRGAMELELPAEITDRAYSAAAVSFYLCRDDMY